MRIGVAIPCYKYHIPALKRCLDSIENQTYKPDLVVVSCSSSTDGDIPSYKYSFPLKIITTNGKKNAAQNRNIATRACDTDIISYIDADDEMHPQRIEIIKHVLQETNADVLFHNFSKPDEINVEWKTIRDIEIAVNRVFKTNYSEGVDVYGYPPFCVHHSQSSIRRYIFDSIQYNESSESERNPGQINCEGNEDSRFCADILLIPNIQTVYVYDKLTRYYREGTTYI
jgi:glycosyltransferase involved in cell wall biosynthesis